MNSKNILPETGFVRIATILQIFPIGRSTWWQGVKDGRFPKPIKLGERTTAWKVEDIKTLIESCNNQGTKNQKGSQND
jgi:predicted DNA-binding transcriptional regulator AlpA